MPAFGTGVNASLGRIDYTPYLQGSLQGSSAIGRGISQLGEGLTEGIKQYAINKEKRDLITQNTESDIVKAAKISDLYRTNPEIFSGTQPFDPKILDDAKNISNFSIGKLNAFSTNLAAVVSKWEPIVEKKNQENITAKQLQSAIGAGYINRNYDPFANALKSGLSPENAMSFANMQRQQAAAASQIRTDTAQIGRSQSQNAVDQAQIRHLNAQSQVLGDEKLPKLPTYMARDINGKPFVIPGTTQDLAQQKALASKTDALKKQEDERQYHLNQFDITEKNIERAIELSKQGAGGALGGTAFFSGASNIFGMDQSKELRNIYKLLQNDLALSKIEQMRSFSKTGGSPVGNASDKDFAALGQNAYMLDPTMSEEKQRKTLYDMLATVQRTRNYMSPPKTFTVEEVK